MQTSTPTSASRSHKRSHQQAALSPNAAILSPAGASCHQGPPVMASKRSKSASVLFTAFPPTVSDQGRQRAASSSRVPMWESSSFDMDTTGQVTPQQVILGMVLARHVAFQVGRGALEQESTIHGRVPSCVPSRDEGATFEIPFPLANANADAQTGSGVSGPFQSHVLDPGMDFLLRHQDTMLDHEEEGVRALLGTDKRVTVGLLLNALVHEQAAASGGMSTATEQSAVAARCVQQAKRLVLLGFLEMTRNTSGKQLVWGNWVAQRLVNVVESPPVGQVLQFRWADEFSPTMMLPSMPSGQAQQDVSAHAPETRPSAVGVNLDTADPLQVHIDTSLTPLSTTWDLGLETPAGQSLDEWLATLASMNMPARCGDLETTDDDLSRKTLEVILGASLEGGGVDQAGVAGQKGSAKSASVALELGDALGTSSPSVDDDHPTADTACAALTFAPTVSVPPERETVPDYLAFLGLVAEQEAAPLPPTPKPAPGRTGRAIVESPSGGHEHVEALGTVVASTATDPQPHEGHSAKLDPVALDNLDDLDDIASALSSMSDASSSGAGETNTNINVDTGSGSSNAADDAYWIDVADLIANYPYSMCDRMHDPMEVVYNAKWDGRVLLSDPSPSPSNSLSKPGGRARSCCVAVLKAAICRNVDLTFVDSAWWNDLANKCEAAGDWANQQACRIMADEPVTAEWLCLVQVCGAGFGADDAAEPWFAADVWQAAMERPGARARTRKGEEDEDAAFATLERVRHDVAYVVLRQGDKTEQAVDRAAVDSVFGVRPDGTRTHAEPVEGLDTVEDLQARYAEIFASGIQGRCEEDEMAAAGLFGDLDADSESELGDVYQGHDQDPNSDSDSDVDGE